MLRLNENSIRQIIFKFIFCHLLFFQVAPIVLMLYPHLFDIFDEHKEFSTGYVYARFSEENYTCINMF